MKENLELAIGYCRVSTKKQEKKGLSLDAQEDYIRNWVSNDGYDIVKIFKVQESGGDSERKHLDESFRYCIENDIKHILITDSDRWTRSREMDVEAQKFIKKHDLKVHIIRERKVIGQFGSAAEKFAHNVKVDADEMIREIITEKVMLGIKEKLKKNEFPGLPPLGYRSVKKTDKSPHRIEQTEDAPKMKELLELFNTGKHTISQTIELAKDLCLRPRKGEFTKGALAKTIKNIFYYGDFVWGGEIYQNKTDGFKPLITKKVWKENQEILKKRTKYVKTKGLSFRFNHLITCSKCGRAVFGVRFNHVMNWMTKKGKTEKKYSYKPYYTCTHGNYYTVDKAGRMPKEYVDEKTLTIKKNIPYEKEYQEIIGTDKEGKPVYIEAKEIPKKGITVGHKVEAHKCDMPSFKEEEIEQMLIDKISLIKFNNKVWQKMKTKLFELEEGDKEFLDLEIRTLRSEQTKNEIQLDKMYEDYQNEVIDTDFFKSRSSKIRERQNEIKERLTELEEEREYYDKKIGTAIEVLDSFKNWEKIFKEASDEKRNQLLNFLTIKISTVYSKTEKRDKIYENKDLDIQLTPEVRELFDLGILEAAEKWDKEKRIRLDSFNSGKISYG